MSFSFYEIIVIIKYFSASFYFIWINRNILIVLVHYTTQALIIKYFLKDGKNDLLMLNVNMDNFKTTNCAQRNGWLRLIIEYWFNDLQQNKSILTLKYLW